MIELQNSVLSVGRQCELLGLNRSTLYYTPAQEDALNLELMRLIDAQFLKTPFYGYRKMTIFLREQGFEVNPKRIQRLMHTVMGI
ncbi:MAG: IS3 family transposase, partial [Anaerolineae bacterium]|nr:IS3 family transposase [Anaerolineae bacterium]